MFTKIGKPTKVKTPVTLGMATAEGKNTNAEMQRSSGNTRNKGNSINSKEQGSQQ